MSLLYQLSSMKNERSEQGNRTVASLIYENPEFIREIIQALQSKNIALLGDCLEVCTMVAENDPQLIAPYMDQIIQFNNHKNKRVRWEAIHAIALISPYNPDEIIKHWENLTAKFLHEKSVIVRDYIVVCAGNLAGTKLSNALLVYPFLIDALNAHNTHHAKLALEGLVNGLDYYTAQREEIEEVADLLSLHPKPSIKKAAKQLLKRLSGKS